LKIGKIILNLFVSFFTPGILLISRGQVSGYIVYGLFFGLQLTSFFTALLYSFWGMQIFVGSWVVLFIIAAIFYLSKLKLHNNRKRYHLLVSIGFAVYAGFYVAGVFRSELRKESGYNREIEDKIEVLEQYVGEGQFRYGKFHMDIFSNYLDDMPVKKDFQEFYQCSTGVYFILKKDSVGVFIEEQENAQLSFHSFKDFKRYVSDRKIRIVSLPIYCGFSKTSDKDSLKAMFRKISGLGIKNIKIVFFKDKNNVETYAGDPNTVRRIKKKQKELMQTGKSRGEALAIAINSINLDCYLFSEVLGSMSEVTPQERPVYMVEKIKEINGSFGCDMKMVIDLALLLTLPWVTYSGMDFAVDSLCKNVDTLY
jgi:hypothetical protein